MTKAMKFFFLAASSFSQLLAVDAVRTMKCNFQAAPTKPNYSLRYDAGYTLQFPKGEFDSSAHTVDVSVKVSPLSGTRPFFFTNHANTPAGGHWDISGNFRIDPGAYRVEALATDDAGRVCRGEWKLEVKPTVAVTPKPRTNARITIILDATPLNSRRVTLSPDDITTLTGTVSALARTLPTPSLRLVVLNLDAKKEFLRREPFTRADFGGLRSALSSIQTATVDYRDARQSLDPASYLADFVAREMEDHPGMVVFLGPQSHSHQAIPPTVFSDPSDRFPPFYYLQYHPRRFVLDPSSASDVPNPFQSARPLPIPMGGTPTDMSPDTIERLMQKLHGRTIGFSTPVEFAHAVERLSPD
jgi:hypothetical protein